MVVLWGLNGLFTFLFGADANGFVHVRDEYFSVTDFPGLGRANDSGDGGLDPIIGQDHFDFYFGQEVHRIFASAIDFGVALLAAKALDFAHGHAFDADVTEGVLHLFQFERFYDCFDFLHSL